VIHGQRLVMSVLLIKALGGGWDASSLSGRASKAEMEGRCCSLKSNRSSEEICTADSSVQLFRNYSQISLVTTVLTSVETIVVKP